MNIFKKPDSENNIFKNEEAFYPDYLPDEILHREREINEIVFAVKSLEEQRKQPSIMLYGPPGTGKTCTARYVVKEFSEYSNCAQLVYINCWQNDTRYAIICKIAQAMDALVPSTGVSIEDMLQRTKQAAEETKKVLLVVLDEVDVLQKKGEDAVLYDLLRMNEIYGIGIGIILITNTVQFVEELDKRIKSSLAQGAIEFEQYGPQEIRDIIKERAKLGLFAGTYNEDIIGACAGFAAKKGGDARIAIALLWMAAKEAEKANRTAIGFEDVEKAKEKIGMTLAETKKEDRIGEGERKLLEIIEKWGTDGKETDGISSGELYTESGMNDRTARKYLSRLEELGFIESEEKALKNGRTRVFRIKKV